MTSDEPDQTTIPAIDPSQFAALVREATDEQLRAGLTANRELILAEIFRRMPAQFDPARAGGVEATVEWRITRPEGGHDAWQIIMDASGCQLHTDATDSPTVTYEIDGVDFIRLITGSASGPKLFLFGRLKIRGNLLLAARMPSFFAIPGADT